MRNSDEIVPGWAGHAVLVVTLFKQQHVEGVLTLAAVLRGRGLACPQVPGLQFLLAGTWLGHSDFPLGGTSPSCLSGVSRLRPPHPHDCHRGALGTTAGH